MTQLAVDNRGLLTISGNGNLQLIESFTSLQQAITTRLKTFKTEWFLDTAIGLPYHQLIFVKGVSKNIIMNAIKAEALKVEGVRTVSGMTFELKHKTRELLITFNVISDIGELNYEGVL